MEKTKGVVENPKKKAPKKGTASVLLGAAFLMAT